MLDTTRQRISGTSGGRIGTVVADAWNQSVLPQRHEGDDRQADDGEDNAGEVSRGHWSPAHSVRCFDS